MASGPDAAFAELHTLPSHGSEDSRKRKKVNYTEAMSDAAFERLLRSDNARRQRPKLNGPRIRAPTSVVAHSEDAETAWAVGLSSDQLDEEEEDILPANADEKLYIQMRNRILVQWRSQVDRYLSEEEAVADIPDRYKTYARVAWRFLDFTGYINFGVAPEIVAQRNKTAKSRGTVVVIGAGLAGLSAANQLQKHGFKVLVLEGHDRPGGRVHTCKLQGCGLQAAADLGGSIITGIDGNPLAVLAKQLKIPLHSIESAQVPLYLADGSLPPNDLDQEVEEAYNKILDMCDKLRELPRWTVGITDNISVETPMMEFWNKHLESRRSSLEEGSAKKDMRERLFRWHLANLEFANAAEARDLSVRSWDQDDPFELPGAHCFLPGGNIRLIDALAKSVDVMYNAAVKRVAYSEQGATVSLQNCNLNCDAVLVTESLGCMKAGNIQYDPPLPMKKQEAIKRLGFGLLNKIMLLFPHNFWEDGDMFGRLPEIHDERGEFYLFYSYADISGGAVLAALVSGSAASTYEKIDVQAAASRIMGILKSMFAGKGVEVPDPIQVLGTRWGSDPLARGSYSSMAVGSLGGEDYDTLAESVGERVFFAGEATTKQYPATMHGAFLTGLREAANISQTLKMIELQKAKHAEEQLSDSKEQIAPLPLDEDELQHCAAVSDAAAKLSEMFALHDITPEVEVGCFSGYLVPASEERTESLAVLRVDMSGAKGRASTKLNDIILLIDQDSLYRLQDVGGDDEARFAFLARLPLVKLVSRLGPTEGELDCIREMCCQKKALLDRSKPKLHPLKGQQTGGQPSAYAFGKMGTSKGSNTFAQRRTAVHHIGHERQHQSNVYHNSWAHQGL